MIAATDLAGTEFDWFAMDEDGAVALFATAGAGFIPTTVLAGHWEHEELSQSIECSDWGTPAVWNAYGHAGLFVFDWKLHSGPYRRVKSPTALMSEEFRLRISAMRFLPHFPGRFGDSDQIPIDWHDA